MGRFFTSFDEAWRFFLDREEDLEDFFAQFPEQESYLLGWLLRLDEALVPAVIQAQGAFSHLQWITPQPDHFLHTWLASVAMAPRRPVEHEIAAAVERAEHAWHGAGSFDLTYRRVNCFHTAVVVEVEGGVPRKLVRNLAQADYWAELPVEGALSAVQIDTFLPHVTIGAMNEARGPEPLRETLVRLREAELGRQRVSEATLCVVPASRTTILDPWEVVGSVSFG